MSTNCNTPFGCAESTKKSRFSSMSVNKIIIDDVSYKARFTKTGITCPKCEFRCSMYQCAPCLLFERKGHQTYLEKEK